MAFDGIVLKNIVKELNTVLKGAKIDKIFQPDTHSVSFGFYNMQRNNYLLNICTHPENSRMHITTHKKANPYTALNFCMVLRKHLLGSKVLSISTCDLERTVEIYLESFDEYTEKTITKKVYIELIGKFSNIILTDQENVIINSLKKLDPTRELKIGTAYTFLKSIKKSFLEILCFEDFFNIVSANNYDLCSFIGFSKLLVQYVCEKLNIKIDTNSKEELMLFYNYMKNLLSSDFLQCKNYEKDYVIDIADSYTLLDINFFIDDYYNQKEEINIFKSSKNHLLKMILKTLEKYTKRLENINTKLNDSKNLEQFQLYGELITSNLYQLKSPVDKVLLENYYNNNELLQIPMDKTISPNENAKRYFKKYHKLKNTLVIVTKQREETENELEYIETLVYSIQSAEDLLSLQELYDELSVSSIFKDFFKELPKKENKKKVVSEPQKLLIDDFVVLVGKNNLQNDYLTFKIAKQNDLWFHTQKIHGSHVILKTDGKNITTEILEKCAKLAMQNSKAKYSSNVMVDYCLVKHVKKPPHAKPGMVIYTNYKTIVVK